MDLSEIAGQVLAYCQGEGMVLGDDLTQVEALLVEQTRRIGAKAIELHLAGRKLGYEGSGRACTCGLVQRFVGHRPKHVATLLGTVEIRRAYYQCPSCQASSFPYDTAVGLGPGPASEGLAKATSLLGLQDPFEPAGRTLHELTGQRLSESTVERLSEQVGGVAARHEEEQATGMAEWKAPRAEATPERLYVSVDGTMVHQSDGWHEAKCVMCYWETPAGRREKRYCVRFAEAAALVPFVWMLACRCGLETAQQVVLLGDGAEWIWKRVGGLLKEAVCIVDWYHAMEHVWAAGHVLYGQGTLATKAWVKDYEALLWDGQVRAMLEGLRGERARLRAANKRAALDGLITYIENQDDRLAYDRFRALGLDIGSGPVESACRHVVGARTKRGGMRWSKAGSQNVLSLRVARLNGGWNRLWATRPLARAA